MAAEWAGIQTVAFCEREPFPQKVLRKHWPTIPIYDDVCTLTKERLDTDGIGTIELIHGGYPCQPFSNAGNRKGVEDDRHLWPEVRRLIESIKPRWFVGENVAGHVTLGLDEVLSDLGDIGYTAQSFIIPACGVNAPHRRDRVFIVANSNSFGWWPGEKHGQSTGNTSRKSTRNSGENVPDTSISGLQVGRRSEWTKSEAETETGMEPESERCGKDVANAYRESKSQTSPSFSAIRSEWNAWDDVMRSRGGIQSGTNWWATEPNVGRVANGISNRVDRLKALGNAVVPQQIYPILAAIKQIDETLRRKNVMKEIICECGKIMEFESIVIPGIEENEDYFICECGKKKGYYEATEAI